MELFKLFGKIAIDNSEANNAIDSTTSKASNLGSNLQKAGSKVSGFGTKLAKTVTAGAAAAGTAVLAFAGKSASAADRIDKMSQKIGISREAYQELDFICSQSGTSVDSLQMGIKSLTAAMDGAATGTKSNVEQFEKLGISVTDADGSLRGQEEVMWETLSALQNMENQTEKARLATELFGRSGTELMPLLNGSADSIEGMKKQAHDLGLVLNDEAIDAGVVYTDKVDQMKRSFVAAAASAGSKLLPVLTDFAQLLIDKGIPLFEKMVEKVEGVVDWFSNLDEGTQKTIVKIAGLVVAAGPLLMILGKVTSGIGSVISIGSKLSGLGVAAGTASTGVKGLSGVFGALASPVAIIIAAIGILAGMFVTLWNTNEEFRNNVVGIWEGIKAKFEEFTSGIVERINALGFDFENISEVIKAVWQTLCDFFAPVFEVAFQLISDVLGAAFDVILGILDFFIGLFTGNWEQCWNGIKEIFGGIIDAIVSVVEGFISLVVNSFTSFLELIGVDWEKVWGNIKTFVSDILNNIKETISRAWETIKNVAQVAVMFLAQLFQLAFDLITLPFRFIWENCKETIIAAWESIKTTVTIALNIIQSVISTVWNAIASFLKPILEAIKNVVTTVFNGIKTVITTVLNFVKTKVDTVINAIKTTFSNGFNAAKNTVTNIFNKIKSTITNTIEGARDKVKGAIDKIKSFFNFSWSLPKLKLPHFKISGSFSLNPPSVPKFGIEWYKKAMNNPLIMNRPTAFGINNLGQVMAGGEAGSEVVSGTNTLMTMISEAVANQNDGMHELLQTLIDILLQYLPEMSNMRLVTDTGALVGAITPQIDTELGRIARRKERG